MIILIVIADLLAHELVKSLVFCCICFTLELEDRKWFLLIILVYLSINIGQTLLNLIVIVDDSLAPIITSICLFII